MFKISLPALMITVGLFGLVSPAIPSFIRSLFG
ncbi:Uncharacterised protein [Burkholderia pseudomallei]|nr:Uncharacterised protein [Burkholderia pseudomallei]VCK80284.1 Uncharacterised protein [Burkholderia pseudomallei]VCK83565.1 Uncharacterised protein [Burkholderia pseudomallei]VCK91572.1 Uncharacterised protein [Burkholderia pseudomallei]VCK96895.1 Uncharacterised protein [Burkholderia pseudomallei]